MGLLRCGYCGISGATGVVVVACTSSSASSTGRLRNGECEESIVSGSTPRRVATTSESHRGLERSCGRRMLTAGQIGSPKTSNRYRRTVVVAEPFRDNLKCPVGRFYRRSRSKKYFPLPRTQRSSWHRHRQSSSRTASPRRRHRRSRLRSIAHRHALRERCALPVAARPPDK